VEDEAMRDDEQTATQVIVTGTGVPHPAPGRAGAGVMVRRGDVSVQFDAGRGTVLRMVEAGCGPHQISAVFVTHVHSDHLVDLADVAMTRWIQQRLHPTGPLTVVVPEGLAEKFVRRMLDPYEDDIHVRREHLGAEPVGLDVRVFPVPTTPTEVWRSEDGSVVVEAVAVRHEPVPEAVGYRVTTPEGVVVISGDTRVCDEVADLATGADVLVHEACRLQSMKEVISGTAFEHIFAYHADSVALGAMAQRSGVAHLVLTHLIPSPSTPEEEAGFERDVRDGGFTRTVTVARDLSTVTLPASM
jgi:ribonuclease Z